MLGQRGHRVTVFERAGRVQPVGAGLLVQPTGMAVLDEIGVSEDVAGYAHPVRTLLGTTPTGRRVLSIGYDDLEPGLTGFGVHRAVLVSALLRAARAADAEIVTGRTCIRVESLASFRYIHTSLTVGPDAERAVRRSGPFDLAIVSDGARSSVRAHAGPIRRARAYPWGALWCVVDGPPESMRGVLRQVYDGARTIIGFLPTGRLEPGGPEQISVFWSIRAADWHGPGAFDFEGWRRRARALLPEAGPVIDRIGRVEDLIYAPYFDVSVEQRDGRTVAIGDAAHATTPQLGQGANLAMLDASSLAAAIDRIGGPVRDVPGAVRAHAAGRRSQSRYYRVASRALTPWFQSSWPLIGPVRDLAMGPMCRFPPTRRQMLLTLAGLKTGFIGARRLPERCGLSPA